MRVIERVAEHYNVQEVLFGILPSRIQESFLVGSNLDRGTGVSRCGVLFQRFILE